MKHKFEINRYWDLNYKDCINISIFPIIDLVYKNYTSLYKYWFTIGWLWFAIDIEYTYYKNN
jgi:hypothetical protein